MCMVSVMSVLVWVVSWVSRCANWGAMVKKGISERRWGGGRVRRVSTMVRRCLLACSICSVMGA